MFRVKIGQPLNRLLLSTVARANEKQAKSFNIAGISHEPNEPIVKTAIPGPKSIALTKDLDKMMVN
jgi:hypothetical protein